MVVLKWSADVSGLSNLCHFFCAANQGSGVRNLVLDSADIVREACFRQLRLPDLANVQLL